MAKPKKLDSEQLSISLPRMMIEELRAEAEEHKLALSAWIRTIIEEHRALDRWIEETVNQNKED